MNKKNLKRTQNKLLRAGYRRVSNTQPVTPGWVYHTWLNFIDGHATISFWEHDNQVSGEFTVTKHPVTHTEGTWTPVMHFESLERAIRVAHL